MEYYCKKQRVMIPQILVDQLSRIQGGGSITQKIIKLIENEVRHAAPRK